MAPQFGYRNVEDWLSEREDIPEGQTRYEQLAAMLTIQDYHGILRLIHEAWDAGNDRGYRDAEGAEDMRAGTRGNNED